MKAPELVLGAVLAAALGGGVVLLTASLRTPDVQEYAPTPPDPRPTDPDAGVVGPIVVTVDATASDGWRYFDFSRGSVVERPGPREWDLAFRRFRMIANGGEGFAGAGGVVDLGEMAPDEIPEAPRGGYVETEVRSDSSNAALEDWYDYGFFDHLLTPKPRTWAVRTAEGHYALVRILGYYCPGARPGCVTLEYRYRPDGGRSFPAAPAAAATPTDDSPTAADSTDTAAPTDTMTPTAPDDPQGME